MIYGVGETLGLFRRAMLSAATALAVGLPAGAAVADPPTVTRSEDYLGFWTSPCAGEEAIQVVGRSVEIVDFRKGELYFTLIVAGTGTDEQGNEYVFHEVFRVNQTGFEEFARHDLTVRLISKGSASNELFTLHYNVESGRYQYFDKCVG